MLQLIGTVLEVTDEMRGLPGQEFRVQEIHVLTGKSDIEHANVGRDFRGGIPSEGETVTLVVVASAYVSKKGNSGVQLTALARVVEPAKPAVRAAS